MYPCHPRFFFVLRFLRGSSLGRGVVLATTNWSVENSVNYSKTQTFNWKLFRSLHPFSAFLKFVFLRLTARRTAWVRPILAIKSISWTLTVLISLSFLQRLEEILAPISIRMVRLGVVDSLILSGDHVIFSMTTGQKYCPPAPDMSFGYVWPIYDVWYALESIFTQQDMTIFVRNLKDHSLTRLSHASGYNAESTISPDGKHSTLTPILTPQVRKLFSPPLVMAIWSCTLWTSMVLMSAVWPTPLVMMEALISPTTTKWWSGELTGMQSFCIFLMRHQTSRSATRWLFPPSWAWFGQTFSHANSSSGLALHIALSLNSAECHPRRASNPSYQQLWN